MRRSASLVPLLLALSFGCTPLGKNAVPVGSFPSLPPEPPADYVLGAGDELSIRFFHTPELNEDMTVRPDGFISLPLALRVPAAGRTAEALASAIATEYASELVDPRVAVIVRSFTAYEVHVGGEVRRPGVVDLPGGRTALEAVMEAGGFKRTARRREVLVIRRRDAGTRVVLSIDLRAALDGEDVAQDIPLHPLDVVYVPRSKIANVNKWVEQYITENLPFNFRLRLDEP